MAASRPRYHTIRSLQVSGGFLSDLKLEFDERLRGLIARRSSGCRAAWIVALLTPLMAGCHVRPMLKLERHAEPPTFIVGAGPYDRRRRCPEQRQVCGVPLLVDVESLGRSRGPFAGESGSRLS